MDSLRAQVIPIQTSLQRVQGLDALRSESLLPAQVLEKCLEVSAGPKASELAEAGGL